MALETKSSENLELLKIKQEITKLTEEIINMNKINFVPYDKCRSFFSSKNESKYINKNHILNCSIEKCVTSRLIIYYVVMITTDGQELEKKFHTSVEAENFIKEYFT